MQTGIYCVMPRYKVINYFLSLQQIYFLFLFLLYVFQYYAIVMSLKGISMSPT
ncbi:hypothetical protein JHK84_050807 [Glycine max]|nr:hypothetical protein JHK84_050807 [Glycine max]